MSEDARVSAARQPGAALRSGAPPDGPGVFIEYFTDPLCCWSWAMEPQWRRLRFEYRGRIGWRYRMAGMIESWQSYHDPVNVIHRPVQMAPLWAQARHLSGMPMADRIWLGDPPGSSYPACLAVAAAGLQSASASERMLRIIREALMVRGLNVAKPGVLAELAGELAARWPGEFDAGRFAADLECEPARAAFREDLSRTRYFQVGRYPTLIVRGAEKVLVMTGCRPYEQLVAALRELMPDLEPTHAAADRSGYEAFWGGVLDREWQEIAAA